LQFKGEEVIGYDAARSRLYQGAKAFSTNGPVENGRVATIVIGPPAAGKSTISTQLARETRAAIVDTDEAKKVIPEYYGGIGQRAVHAESVELMWGQGGVADRLMKEGANLVVPRVGTDVGDIRRLVDALAKEGYGQPRSHDGPP
jgi:Mrp family chromosome partitioning ATPase